eukprot:1190138-Prorocentrum_minimum.AAC.1
MVTCGRGLSPWLHAASPACGLFSSRMPKSDEGTCALPPSQPPNRPPADLLEGLHDLVRVPEVHHLALEGPPCRTNLLRQRVEALAAPAHPHHLDARGGQLEAQHPPDAARGPRHHHHLACPPLQPCGPLCDGLAAWCSIVRISCPCIGTRRIS